MFGAISKHWRKSRLAAVRLFGEALNNSEVGLGP
jgi:hypothetical protein